MISESSQQFGDVRLISFKDLEVELDYFKELGPAVVLCSSQYEEEMNFLVIP